MAKQITPFINMCQEDQIALLKGGCTELMILRSIISYNPEKNSWSVSVMIQYIALDKLTPHCIGQIYTEYLSRKMGSLYPHITISLGALMFPSCVS